MITPRRTRLVRVPDLHAFRRVIESLAAEALVVVPTTGAARQLARRTPAIDCATRDELYDRLHARLADPPRRLTALERDVVAQQAAREAAAREADLAFRVRPGLVAEMLRFYDHLRRQSQQVNRFEELILDALTADGDLDRGAARMRQQTRFLAEAFREYERAVHASGAVDEHLLRERLIAERAADPVAHVVVTIADWIADADGLYVADFDLLARIPALQSIDIVATEALLRSGFHERLHNWWPGIEETTPSGSGIRDSGLGIRPVLIIPEIPNSNSASTNPQSLVTNPHRRSGRPSGRPSDGLKPVAYTDVKNALITDPDQQWWTLRDREEEIVSIARQLKADRRAGESAPLDRVAIVFKHPLPYLYIAAETFPSARIRYQSSDTLPLAIEPTAAALDLALEAVAADFNRESLVSLLRSPHFAFVDEGREVARLSVSALNRALSDLRYLGDIARLEALATEWPAAHRAARPALRAALALARELSPLAESRRASEHSKRLLAFWTAHLRPIADADPLAGRERRARAAVTETLAALAAVHESHEDPEWTIDDFALAVRRALEDQTFEPESDRSGVHLLDDRAAPYGDFDDVAIVGVVETDWPDRPRRNIFYPAALLRALGWPSEKDRRAAADARFVDLLASASRRTVVSTFMLDDEALVSRSTQLDEIPRARLSAIARAPFEDARVFVDEALSLDPPMLGAIDEPARTWADLRVSRSPADQPQFHGYVGTGSRTLRGNLSPLMRFAGTRPSFPANALPPGP